MKVARFSMSAEAAGEAVGAASAPVRRSELRTARNFMMKECKE